MPRLQPQRTIHATTAAAMIMNIDLAGLMLVAAGLLLLPFFGVATLVAIVVLLRMDHTGETDGARKRFWRQALASSFVIGVVCVLFGFVVDRNFSRSALNTLDETWWLWGPLPLVAYVSLLLRARRRYRQARASSSVRRSAREE